MKGKTLEIDEMAELSKLIKLAFKLKIDEKIRWEIIKSIQNQINRIYED